MTQRLAIVVGIVLLMWLLEIVDLLTPWQTTDIYGIRPRSLDGLSGIVLAPFLHGGLAHLAANTIPFIMLGWLVIMRGIGTFVAVSLLVMLAGGLGVWVLGRPGTVHVGASGIIFGYIGYLMARGYFDRSFVSIVVALIVGVLYGGAIWGVLPGQRGISWEGHLFGFLAGILAAWLLQARR
ncbi:MAG: rhomboid family intramembrane serine protease [Chloroflexi bacterium]|nr:rhomboid family intramembrane serine protease [Chloroflexota bacterium]